VSFNYGYLVESMVSILLLLTILYCVRLNKQLRLLKADEQTLRVTIAELLTATESAERAIGGLRSTMHDGEQSLSERLERMEQISGELDEKLAAGEELLTRISRIASAARGGGAAETAVPDANAVAAAAQAFAARAQARLGGRAA
jgi:chromosome segregation ATPase